jgi:N6-L-threonylcarbamoyladenine synthase
LIGKPGCDFSFSGLKTAVRQLAEAQENLDHRTRADIAAAFQQAAGDVLADRAINAMHMAEALIGDGARRLVVAGGVASNLALRARLETAARSCGYDLIVPPPKLCTDNGAMIAWAGAERLALGSVDGLEASPLARWPLDPDARPARGAGVKA